LIILEGGKKNELSGKMEESCNEGGKERVKKERERSGNLTENRYSFPLK